jgi:hypothetical protein
VFDGRSARTDKLVEHRFELMSRNIGARRDDEVPRQSFHHLAQFAAPFAAGHLADFEVDRVRQREHGHAIVDCVEERG